MIENGLPIVFKRCTECGGHGYNNKKIVGHDDKFVWRSILFCTYLMPLYVYGDIQCTMCKGYGILKVRVVQM